MSEQIPDKNSDLQKKKSKRFVKAVKVFMTEEERSSILEKSVGYGGISNYIRFQLGLPLNLPGRKRQHLESAFDLDLNDYE